MQSSYKSKFIKLTLVLMVGSFIMQIFTKKSHNIGGVNITPQMQNAYFKLHNDKQKANSHLIYNLLSKSKYNKLNLYVPNQKIIEKAKTLKLSSKFSNAEKILLSEHSIISDHMHESIKSSIIINDKTAYNYAKGLLQRRNGKKLVIKYSDININISEQDIQNYYKENINIFHSDRITTAKMWIANTKNISKELASKLANKNTNISTLKKEHSGQEVSISWTNGKNMNKYTFLRTEPQSKYSTYESSDGNIIYIEVQKITEKRPLSYDEAKDKAKSLLMLELQKKNAVHNLHNLIKNKEWSILDNQKISNSKDSVVLFLTSLNEINYYINSDSKEIVVIIPTKIINTNPTKKDIEDSRKIIQNHIFNKAAKSFIESIYLSYEGK